jgi:hypothetical protein
MAEIIDPESEGYANETPAPGKKGNPVLFFAILAVGVAGIVFYQYQNARQGQQHALQQASGPPGLLDFSTARQPAAWWCGVWEGGDGGHAWRLKLAYGLSFIVRPYSNAYDVELPVVGSDLCNEGLLLAVNRRIAAGRPLQQDYYLLHPVGDGEALLYELKTPPLHSPGAGASPVLDKGAHKVIVSLTRVTGP